MQPDPEGPENPHGVGFSVHETVLATELQAKRRVNSETSRIWKIKNMRSRNSVTGAHRQLSTVVLASCTFWYCQGAWDLALMQPATEALCMGTQRQPSRLVHNHRYKPPEERMPPASCMVALTRTTPLDRQHVQPAVCRSPPPSPEHPLAWPFHC